MTPTEWDYIAVLARPSVPAGKSDHLAAALAIAARNDDRWSELHNTRHPTPPLAEYPEAAAAVAELEMWARDQGGLVPLATPVSSGTEVPLHTLCSLANEAATPTTRAGLDATAYLGYRLVVEGRGLLEALIGVTELERAFDRAHHLGVPTTGWQLPGDHELVRILAATALTDRYLASPEGMAAYAERARSVPVAVRASFRPVAVETRELEVRQKLWLVVLGDARSSATDRAMVERIKHAGAGTAGWTQVSQLAELIAGRLENLRAPTERTETPQAKAE